MIDQMLDRDQHAVEIERMTMRQIKVAPRHVVGERPRSHDDRPREAVPPGHKIAAKADPSDRLRCARQRHHPVADRQILDRHLAALGQDPGAAAEAGRRDVGAGAAIGSGGENGSIGCIELQRDRRSGCCC